MPPSPVLSKEAVQSHRGKHGCKETRPADCSAMRIPRKTCSFLKVWSLSCKRASPRGYAFFVPLGGGERPFGFTPTFTGQRHYIKKPPRECAAVFADGRAITPQNSPERSGRGLANAKSRIGILLPARIHLAIVFLDELLDSGNLMLFSHNSIPPSLSA